MSPVIRRWEDDEQNQSKSNVITFDAKMFKIKDSEDNHG